MELISLSRRRTYPPKSAFRFGGGKLLCFAANDLNEVGRTLNFFLKAQLR
jgi:hypothetical protein